jgi:4-amino-4-deoxy-L-arabinose transferase-like glycosyltransferase
MTTPSAPHWTARLARFGHWLLEHPVWLFALFALWLGATIGLRPLFVPDEGRYVGVALSMLHTGDWLVPKLDGLPFFHKPPLFYWITATSLAVFGTHEWAARAAPFLAGMASAITLFWFLSHYASRRAAGFGVMLLGTFPLFFDAAQFASMDMLVGSLISITILLLAHVSQQLHSGKSATRILVLAYATAGLGMMTKGMIGFVLPGMVITFWLLWNRRFTHLYKLISLPGLVVFLAIVTPWFALMELKFPGFLHYTFIYQQFDRYLDSSFNNPQPIYFYVMVLFGGLIPWAVGLFWLTSFPNNRQLMSLKRTNHLLSLGVVWLSSILLFFSIPTSKLIGYILPTVPSLALLLALAFDKALTHTTKEPAEKLRWQGRIAIMALIGALLSVTTVVIFAIIDHKSHKEITLTVRDRIAPDADVVFYNYYYFSVPFYLDRTQPALVTGPWDDPNNFRSDGANTELYTSAKFDPQAAKHILISTDQLGTMATEAKQGKRPPVWIFVQRDDAQKTPLFADQRPVTEDKRAAIYCFGCTEKAQNRLDK